MNVVLLCPYCKGAAKFFQTSESFYNGTDYGPLWACVKCGAWVGCHPGTNKPLGRLADAELRRVKRRVHIVFDPIWQSRYERKHADDPRYKRAMARGGRYKKLAELLGIPKTECHIGMFDVPTCKRAIEICLSGKLSEDACQPS